MSTEKGMHLVNRHPTFGSFLFFLLAALGPSSAARAEEPRDGKAEAKLDLDHDLDMDEVMEMAQEQIDAASDQIAEAAADQAEKLADKEVEAARKHASEQMEAARKQLEEARRQWQKQIEESRKQMRVAASLIRAIARRERLTGALSRVGIVAKPPDASSSSPAGTVQAVTPGSPAEKAGIKAGDVITSVNGYQLQQAPDAGTDDHDASRVARLLRSRGGRPIEVEYRRGKEVRKATIQPESHSGWGFWYHDNGRSFRSVQLPGGWASLELTEINPALGAYFGTSRGLLVLRASMSPDVKLKAGDVILKIGDEEPSTPRQAVRLLRSYEPGQSIPVEIVRQKKKQKLALQMPASGAKKQ
jgi:C-terminal processing protease CtpA/Prc